MKNFIIMSFLIVSFTSFSQEFTVKKSYILNNEKIWQLQDDDLTNNSYLIRVLFFQKKGIGFVYGNYMVNYIDYSEWEINDNIYTYETIGGPTYKIEFNHNKSKVNFIYINIDILIKDEIYGEVTRNTHFRFEL